LYEFPDDVRKTKKYKRYRKKHTINSKGPCHTIRVNKDIGIYRRVERQKYWKKEVEIGVSHDYFL
jgi:hypothetical protein